MTMMIMEDSLRSFFLRLTNSQVNKKKINKENDKIKYTHTLHNNIKNNNGVWLCFIKS